MPTDAKLKKKKKPGIPTGNAGEYFVMGELLRRGYDDVAHDRRFFAVLNLPPVMPRGCRQGGYSGGARAGK